MVIEIENLEKSFKEVKAVDKISFKVKEGELFAFLGINGAGKSTTINIISGVLSKDSGSVKVCGYDIDENSNLIKSKIGIVFQNSVLDKRLTVYDNLKSRANLCGIFGNEFKERLEEICDLLDLKEILKRPLMKLSGGQKQRVSIARAIVHDPEIILADEPTGNLDSQNGVEVIKLLQGIADSGKTVVLVTHNIDDARKTDRMVVLKDGKIQQMITNSEEDKKRALDEFNDYDESGKLKTK